MVTIEIVRHGASLTWNRVDNRSCHNLLEPSFVCRGGGTTLESHYRVNGIAHRVNGPAVFTTGLFREDKA